MIIVPSPAFFAPAASTWIPTDLGAALIGWWIADTGVTTSSGNVTAVTDQSGNGKTLTNSGTVPYNATGFNGLPTFDFVASNNAGLNNDAFTGFGTGATGSAFFVGQMDTGTANYGRAMAFQGTATFDDWNCAESAVLISRSGTSNTIESTKNSAQRGSQSISLNTNYRIGVIYDGADATIYLNNSANTPVALTTAFGSDGGVARIGIGNGFVNTTFGGSAWEGPISEIVITNTALSSGDRNSLDDYFTTKWGI